MSYNEEQGKLRNFLSSPMRPERLRRTLGSLPGIRVRHVQVKRLGHVECTDPKQAFPWMFTVQQPVGPDSSNDVHNEA